MLSSPPPQTTETNSLRPPAPKILFVGDSISSAANIKTISDATKHKIVTAKAYTAKYDDIANVAKDPAHFPQKNFLDVVPKEASKDTFEYVIIQSGSVDISNLKTNFNP